MIAVIARRLATDTRGAAAIEFALLAPVMLVGMLGVFDLGYNMYTASVLHGSIQKAARDSTIEGAEAQGAALDNRVTAMVRTIAPGATLEFNRLAYASFTDVGQPEDFTDVDGNGSCNDGEPFEDANSNGSWDADQGAAGFGSARDAVMYEVTVTYERVFPIWKLIGQPGDFTTVVRTVLRNQPYEAESRSDAMGNCA